MHSVIQIEVNHTFSKTLSQLIDLCESEIEKLFLLQLINYVSKRPHRFGFEFIVEIVVPEFHESSDELTFPKEANYDLAGAPGQLLGLRININTGIVLEIFPQKVVQVPSRDNELHLKNLRLDFEICKYNVSDKSNPIKRYSIECDGLQYHQTKEQLKYDNERVRNLSLLKNYDTLRFLGTEIYNHKESDIGYILQNL